MCLGGTRLAGQDSLWIYYSKDGEWKILVITYGVARTGCRGGRALWRGPTCGINLQSFLPCYWQSASLFFFIKAWQTNVRSWTAAWIQRCKVRLTSIYTLPLSFSTLLYLLSSKVAFHSFLLGRWRGGFCYMGHVHDMHGNLGIKTLGLFSPWIVLHCSSERWMSSPTILVWWHLTPSLH